MTELPESVQRSALQLRQRLVESLDAHDKAGAVDAAIVAVRERRIEVEELYELVLAPLLVSAGSRWQRGEEPVWEEHFATATARTIVESLHPLVVERTREAMANGLAPAGRALLASPPGEQHDLGLRMLADRMQLAGWDTYFLGADTPVDDIAAAAETLAVDLVALSAATHYNVVLARRVIDELRRRLPGVAVGIGGPAVICATDWPAEDVLSEEALGLRSFSDPACPT